MSFCFIDYQFEARLKPLALNQLLINNFDLLVDDLARECKIWGKRGLWRWTAKRKHSLCQKTIFAKLQVQALILVLYLELIKLVSFPTFFHKKVFELEKWEIFFWEMYFRIWHFFLQIPGVCNVLSKRKRGSTSNRE